MPVMALVALSKLLGATTQRKILAYNGGLHDIITIMGNTVGSLTKLERSIIVGSILGDGHVRIIPGRSDAFLEINHSLKAKDYVNWKFKHLKRICISSPKERNTNDGRIAYRFFTRQHKDITALYRLFYRNRRKVIPRNIHLDPLSIAVWYMDDGSKSRSSDIYLNSQQFAQNDQRMLLFYLREHGIRARLNRDKKYYRIRILKDSIADFMKFIEPHVAPSMQYKLVMTP